MVLALGIIAHEVDQLPMTLIYVAFMEMHNHPCDPKRRSELGSQHPTTKHGTQASYNAQRVLP